MNDSANENHKALFISLTTMLSMSALQQLGKLMNPLTRKTEINLEAAQSTIDMLDMLEAKTRGNLDAEEAKLMRDTLAMLKMNYVETADSQEAASPGQPPPASGPSAGAPADADKHSEATPKTAAGNQGAEAGEQKSQPRETAAGPAAADQKSADKSPKFRKKYA